MSTISLEIVFLANLKLRFTCPFQANVNVWPASKVAIAKCLANAVDTVLGARTAAIVSTPIPTVVIRYRESVFANPAGKVNKSN